MIYYSVEAEQSVLGSILISSDLMLESILTSDDFYDERNKIIYTAMESLRDNDKKIDMVTLSTELGDDIQHVGGIQYISQLANFVPSTVAFDSYQRIVKDKSLLRNGIKSIKEIYASGIDDPRELVAELSSVIESLEMNVNGDVGLKHVCDGVMRHFDALSDKKYNGVAPGACTVGCDLDKITGKWKKQSLNIVAARPSVGKTAFALNNATKNGEEGLAVAIFSLEMPEEQLYDRMLSAICIIEGDRISNATLTDQEWERYTLGLAKLAEMDLYIDDRPGLTIHEIRSEVRKLKKKHDNIVVYVDYLQLIKGGSKYTSKNRNEEVGYVSSMLKQIARENDCPVIALAQLSRGVEQRQDKRPLMSDLRESGNIEQDADTITFLYRDDYYDKATEKKNIIEIIVAKNRNGITGTAEMLNLKQYGKFVPLTTVRGA